MSKFQLDLKRLKDEFQGRNNIVCADSPYPRCCSPPSQQKKKNKINYRLAKRAVFAVIIAWWWCWPLGVKRRAGRVGLVWFFSLQLRIFQPGVLGGCRGWDFNDGERGAQHQGGLGL